MDLCGSINHWPCHILHPPPPSIIIPRTHALPPPRPPLQVDLPPFSASCGQGVQVAMPGSPLCLAYNVVQGDTLSSIASEFHTTVSALMLLNPILASGGVLQPGVQVILPPS